MWWLAIKETSGRKLSLLQPEGAPFGVKPAADDDVDQGIELRYGDVIFANNPAHYILVRRTECPPAEMLTVRPALCHPTKRTGIQYA
mmetsp:Transcript_37641/g.97682  ORF Transcript_37641/g.97682 Transcript_37641/m.97682 type:complete len:87 (-) Transcript_37641:156-416(-)